MYITTLDIIVMLACVGGLTVIVGTIAGLMWAWDYSKDTSILWAIFITAICISLAGVRWLFMVILGF